jgi:hypothetical protein
MFKALWLVLASAGLAACSSTAATPPPGASAPTAVAGPTIQATLAPTPLPAIPEERRLTLEWPSTIRTGESNRVYLTLDVDKDGKITPTVREQGNVTKGETVYIPNLYETHYVYAEARLDLAGTEVSPSGDSQEPMLPGKVVTFFWSVKPESTGSYRGTVTVHLHFVPMSNTSGQESRILLSAQPIDIEAVNFLGLGGIWARIVGGIGTLVGSVLGLDNVLSWLWKRLRKKPE